MNLPCDQPFKENISFSTSTFKSFIAELKEKNFSGFLEVSLNGSKGMEDGLIVLKNGLLMAASYSFLNLNVSWNGDEALEAFVNAGMAQPLVGDSFILQPQQIDLLLSFNPSIKVSQGFQKDFFKKINQLPFKIFNESFAQSAEQKSGVLKVESKESLLTKFGFEGLQE